MPIADTCGAVFIVMLGDGVHPVGRVAGNGRHLFGGQSLAKPPHDWPVATRHGIVGRTIPLLQCVRGEGWLDDKSRWPIHMSHSEVV
jgi:hypothetical protein